MIGLIGLDHQRAPSDVRGRLSFAGDELARALRALLADPALDEAIILSTCNRTEVYFAGPDWSEAVASLERFALAAVLRPAISAASAPTIPAAPLPSAAPAPDADDLLSMLYLHEGTPAMRHLLRVAAGLESMVVGEAQILGQVKDALAAAESAGSVGDELRSLFTAANRAGKRARSETELGRVDVSVASVAVSAAADELGDLEGKRALVIGAGRTSRLCAETLRARGVGALLLANRTPALAARLARDVAGEAISLEQAATRIAESDLVVTATAAPYAVLETDAIAAAMSGRVTPLVILDLAVPPDVEASAGEIAGVRLHTLDTLREHSGQAHTVAGGEATLRQVEEVVEDALRDHLRQRTMRLAVPGIAALRRHVDRSEQAELARALAELAHLSERDRRVVERFGQRLVDKMFHHLVSRVRSLAEYDEVPPDVTMQVLANLFADPDASSAARERPDDSERE